MPSPSDPVHYRTLRTTMEAQLVKSLLEGAGIPARIPGEMLQDEWASWLAATQRMGTQVWIPGDRVAEADRVLAAARRAGEETVSPPEDPETPAS